MEKKNLENDFEMLPAACNDPEIVKEDFTLVDSSKKVSEQKFQTRPTTFLKDSLKRFAKNKSSLIAAYILGALLLLAFIVPIADTNDIKKTHSEIYYLEPKLFDKNDAGFWDGTKEYNNISVDISAKPDASTDEEKQEYWWPSATLFEKCAVGKKTFSDWQYTDAPTTFGVGGYIQAGYMKSYDMANPFCDFKSREFDFNFDISVPSYVTKFEVYDVEALNKVETLKTDITAPNNYDLTECCLVFLYNNGDGEEAIELTDYSMVHNVGGDSRVGAVEEKINIVEKIKAAKPTVTEFKAGKFAVRLKHEEAKNACCLIKSLVFETESTNEKMTTEFVTSSIVDATKTMNETNPSGSVNYKFWSCNSKKGLYLSQVIFCSFVYDTYEAALGTKIKIDFPTTKLEEYYSNGWIDWFCITKVDSEGKYSLDEDSFSFEILPGQEGPCPIAENITPADIYVDPDNGMIHVNAMVTYWKYYGYSSMPRFLAGTDKNGYDMLKYVFEGLRTSLLLGILTFAVCFLFGLAWGAISGYFGGTVDLVMERITDILSGVPWIVVMTLAIIKFGSGFWTFALALCLTGWIGTAATTRTQFYRFRGREYVLASRTLGASDFRLIFKHILPNAMGTIITGAVLMIPSVIFSEATISYLGLGLQDMKSLGVILSDNQSELTNNPYLLIFPSIVIALLMISFNLFGNGLRDAVNPSLKGEGE